MQHIRPDLRQLNELRPISTDLSIVNEADSSCSLTVGNTYVIASLYGPSAPKYSRHEQFDRCTVEVEINFINKENALNGTNITVGSVESGQNHHQERELSQHVRGMVESTVCLNEYPRSLILLRLNIVRNDGGLLSTVLNACSLLLCSSGLKMIAVPISISIVTMPANNMAVEDEDNSLFVDVVDAALIEEKDATTTSTFTLQYANGASQGVLMSDCVGSALSVSKLTYLLSQAEKQCDIIYSQLKQAL